MSARSEWQRNAIVAFWYSLTMTTAICSPEILAALMKPRPLGAGLSVTGAGLLLTAEMIANGCIGLASRLFASVSSRLLIVAGLVTALAANIATITAAGFGTLLALRIIAGVGMGAIIISASRFIAASQDPDRLSSLLLVYSTVLNGGVLIAIGNSSPSMNMVFAVFAALTALGLLLVAIPSRAHAESTAAQFISTTQTTNSRQTLIRDLLLIAATGLLNTADGGLYALTGVVGERAGVGEVMLGYILTGAMVAGVVAAVAAGRLRTPASRSVGLIGSILAKGCVAVALVRMSSVGGFGAMAVLYSVTYFYATPLVLGASAHLDRSGRLAAQISGAIQVGTAIGPAWAASLDEVSGTRAVASVCAAGLLLSALLCLRPLRAMRALDRHAQV